MRPQLDLFGAAEPIASAPALDMPKDIARGAVLSDCGQYRYMLSRTWSPAAPRALFVLLNPSTADATIDDPTVRRCIGFAHAWGCGGLNIVNVFALRATDPRELWSARWDRRVGPDNDRYIASAIASSDGALVVGWGRIEPPAISRELVRARVAAVLDLLRASRREVHCLGVNQDGSPKHPLYLPTAVRPQAFALPGDDVDSEDDAR